MNNQKNILLVEDEGIIALAESKTMKRMGYEVIIANSGEKALELLEKNQSIDLILMDIDLGKGIDGTETAGRILERKNIPIVFLSSHTEKEMVKKVRGITRYGYIMKDSGDFVLQSSIEMAYELFEAFEKLREREERYKNLFETMPDSTFIIEHNTGKIIDANPSACRNFGYTREEFYTKKMADISAEPEVTIASIKSGDTFVPLRMYKKKDGTVFPVEITGGHFKYGNQLITTAFIRDITERKSTDDNLKRSEQRYRALIETTGTGYVILDKTGKVMDANREYVRLTGRGDLKEIAGHSVLEWTAEEEKDKNAAAVAACIKAGCIRDLEITYIDKSGSRTHVEINATVVETEEPPRILTLCRDITGRKRLENILRVSENKFRSIFENSPAGVALVGLDGRYLDVNPAFSLILGYSAEELLTIDFFKITHPDDIDLSRKTMQDVFDRKGRNLRFNKRYIHKDGHTIWAEVNSTLVYGADGEPLHFVTLITDITEHKKPAV